MLVGYDLVYFGPERWAGLWRNRHQLMTIFARRNRVLYVEPRAYLRPTLRRWQRGEIKWAELRRSRLAQVRENLYVYCPSPLTPISGRSPLQEVLDLADRWMLWRTMHSLGWRAPVVWLSRPTMFNRMGQFNAALTIYHVVDEYTAYGDGNLASRELIREQEQRLLQRVDLVIVVSENLLRSKRPLNQHTYLVPNGVDYSRYAKVMDSDAPPPADIVHLPRPVIGYSGLIAARLDMALLREIALSRPEWSLVLIGAVDDRYCAAEWLTLRQMPNVHCLGIKEVDLVPRYIKAFDVCLVPYTLSERADNASPLKLYDYLAAGKPIVTTAFAAADAFREVVRIADSNEAFIRHIEAALSEKDDDLPAKRRRIAADNTWERRVEQLSDIIQSHWVASRNQPGRRTQ